MPRNARKLSESGIYHIMLRGTNRQEIFHDDEDNEKFLKILKWNKKKSGFSIYGWCILGNHVHLLFRQGKEDISITMKRIGVSYAWYYNRKYNTTGHLFQDRYRSENIDNNGYFITVVRYIHFNPVKAGLANRPDEWKWSSYRIYKNSERDENELLDYEYVQDIISDNNVTDGIDNLVLYNGPENSEMILEDSVRVRLNDNDARTYIKMRIGDYEIAEIKGLPKSQRDEVIAGLKGIKGLTQRQISRIFGIPLSLVNRA